MRINIFPLYKREMRGYFSSPIAYAVTAMFLLVTGYFFFANMMLYHQISVAVMRAGQQAGMITGLNPAEGILRPLYMNMSIVMLLMLPLVTMRLVSEEKRAGTIELLFTYPIRDVEFVLAKYLAAMTVFASMLALSSVSALMLWHFEAPPIGNVFAGYMGLLLLGGSFIAVGLFVSSVTENQIIAAAVTFALLLVFWMAGWSFGGEESPVAQFVRYSSILTHMDSFAKGVIDTKDVAYYCSVIFFFLFLAVRSVESHRWRG